MGLSMYSGRVAVAAVAVFFSTSSIHAADLAAAPTEPVAPAIAPYDWNGPYIGVHAGYGWGREEDNQGDLFPGFSDPRLVIATSADKFDLDGFVGGAHAGYNYQIDRFVLGVEGDLDYTNLSGSARAVYAGGAVVRTLELKTDWQGSARLRAGYAIDNLLLYATGGVAFANAKLTTAGQDSSNTHIGWTVGLGAEYAFTPSWIGRAEIRYSDFSKKSYETVDGPVKAGWNQTTATLGVSYKF
ncbi:porin [Labrys miyagiensis]|uniref:Porin n=1 Tax=Labrys miyagiensis TaxID=346912 RepID=A0ABQ6CM59_9HYPH|nr:outer membrane protein [Labrys miyagiensis]GLS21393.1 porin [Labrys miyagiensis]